MSNASDERRDSYAVEPDLISDPQKLAEAEAKNGLRQYDTGIAVVQSAIEHQTNFKLRLSLIMALHREALAGISNFAGNFRPGSVIITKSNHTPPEHHLELLGGMLAHQLTAFYESTGGKLPTPNNP